jgi:hypothetical protein
MPCARLAPIGAGDPLNAFLRVCVFNADIQKINASFFVYIADRFEPYVDQKVSPRYVWLPITDISANSLTVRWHDSWSL